MEVNDYLPSHIRVLSSESGKIEPDLVTTPFDAELAFTSAEEETCPAPENREQAGRAVQAAVYQAMQRSERDTASPV